MMGEHILVDGEAFLGRLPDQERFRQALRTALAMDRGGGAPFVFLVLGEPGSGKSKFLRCLRDIATVEPPFDTEIQTILADWEVERDRHVRLKLPPAKIQPEIIFAHLYSMARDAGWGHHFNDYQAAIRLRTEVEGKIADLLEQANWDQRFSGLQFLEPVDLGRLVRGEFAQAGHDPGWVNGRSLEEVLGEPPEALELAREHVQQWISLESGLKPEEEQVFTDPASSMARALGLGLAKVSQAKPLVLMQDSFDIVAPNAPWFRDLMAASGPRVIWVFAGEKGLKHTLSAAEIGVPADRMVLVDLPELTFDEVSEYLRFRAPDRLLTPTDLAAIYGATRGIPIVLQIAADLWASGVPLDDITDGFPEQAPREELIELMSQRLLLHCGDPEDRRAFVLMAIQRRPGEQIQTAVMRPDKGNFDYTEFLERLRGRYLSVNTAAGADLHERISSSLCAYLLRHRMRVTEEVKAITTRATEAINKNRDRLEAGFARLEDRFESDEWREIMLDSDHWMFWHNEFSAWRQFNRDFVDSLGYDPDLTGVLLRMVEGMDRILNRDGQQRLRVIQAGMAARLADAVDGSGRSPKAAEKAELEMFAELDRWLVRYGGKDVYTNERRAILDLRKGQAYQRRGRYNEALNLFLAVEKNLPARGESLQRQFGMALEKVGEQLAWQRRGMRLVAATPSADAEQALKKSLAFGRRRARIYHALGAVQVRLGKIEAALENLLQAVTLNPGNPQAWKDLGDVYFHHQRYDKAVPAYRRAVELNPRFIRPQLSLAVCLRELGKMEDFEPLMARLKRQVGDENEYVQACFEAVNGRAEQSIALIEAAVNKKLVSREWVRKEPFFEVIRNHPAFRRLIGF